MLRAGRGEWEEALAQAQRGVRLDPSDPFPALALAVVFNFSGRPDDAIRIVEQALLLDPLSPFRAPGLFQLGIAYRLKGDYERAIEELNRTLQVNPSYAPAFAMLAATYMDAGRPDKAREAAEELQRTQSGFSVGEIRLQFRDPREQERLLAGLRAAGVPE